MTVLLTNIDGNILNHDIIKESLIKLKNSNELINEKLTEIFYLNEKIPDQDWEFNDMKLNKFKIDLNKDMEEIYGAITQIIENILNKNEFIDVIVDTSFLAYIILEILIKNFDITDVFILKNGVLEKAHPCGCGPESMGY